MLGTKVCGFRSYSGNQVLCTWTMMRWPFWNVYACWCRSTVNGWTVFGGIASGRSQLWRYRQSWERPEAIPPNTVQPFTVDLHQQAYTFQKGHRIMVQVQSTWFPLYDRNPQTFVPNIFQARAEDYKARVHRVYRTAQYPSNVEVDV